MDQSSRGTYESCVRLKDNYSESLFRVSELFVRPYLCAS